MDQRLALQVAYSVRDSFFPAANDEWAHSPLRWVRELSPQQRGAMGQRFVREYARRSSYAVASSPNTQCDLLINGWRCEIKLSTRWRSGALRFQQIRDQQYDFVICVGVLPLKLICLTLPKEEAMARSTPQHAGTVGQDTRWLTFPDGNQLPRWTDGFQGLIIPQAR